MKYWFSILLLIVNINLFSQDVYNLAGFVYFNKNSERLPNQLLRISSSDLHIDSIIITDSNGCYKILLPKGIYSISILNKITYNTLNDSLWGLSSIDLTKNKECNIKARYNYMYDYNIFRTGFSKIYSKSDEYSVRIGLMPDNKFRKTVFIGNFTGYSFIENGTYKIIQDTLFTKTISVDSYYSDDSIKYTGSENFYIIQKNTSEYLIDKYKNKYQLEKFSVIDEYSKSMIMNFYEPIR